MLNLKTVLKVKISELAGAVPKNSMPTTLQEVYTILAYT